LLLVLSAASLTIWNAFGWHGPDLASGVLVAIATLAALLLLGIALVRGRPGDSPTVTRTTLWLTAGMVVQFAVLFIYYSASGLLWMIAVAWVVLAACAAVALITAPAVEATNPGRTGVLLVALAGLIAPLGIAQLTVATGSGLGSGQPAPATLTVMTFNIQSGFSVENDWDLEAQAQVIEAQDPDLVVLQEVSRGWLVTTGSDDLLWLSRRLDMAYVWGPASDDGLWGNAILSRAPLSGGETEQFTATENLKRSAVMAQVATEAGPLWVIGTHLDNPSGAGSVRSAQISELLTFWDGRTPALILGDFNAVPNDPVIATVVDAGFVDVGGTLSSEQPTSESGRRIDYIFATSALTVDAVSIPQVDASDHRPVVATLTLNP
jgi:endonuclease/exonuclease/phosphatase family metal-dependent hydrolase